MPKKTTPYECGFEAFEDSRMKFDVRYYLVAILFIIFDLEIAFLFPWAIVLDEIGTFGLVAMGVFLSVLVVGFIFEWKKRGTRMGVEGVFEQGFMTTSADKLINWARTGSIVAYDLWLSLLCC